jgi:hypothetical protein
MLDFLAEFGPQASFLLSSCVQSCAVTESRFCRQQFSRRPDLLPIAVCATGLRAATFVPGRAFSVRFGPAQRRSALSPSLLLLRLPGTEIICPSFLHLVSSEPPVSFTSSCRTLITFWPCTIKCWTMCV